ncbi:hypothetical protein MKEN_01418400 [Mycena kentingensis (nom. inval.)]|nr:hypothetical protein MKEN_01418400 [Mycena kentingensis (nom. inval.)]
MAILPPGILFLGRNLLIPSFLILIVQAAVSHPVYGFGLAPLTALLVAFLTAFVAVISKSILTTFSHVREARRHGARLPPTASGSMLGNIDVLRRMLRASREGYVGEAFSALVDSLGPILNIRVLWSDKIFTVTPEHVKIVLATDFKNYIKGPSFISGMHSVLGSGVFNSDGEMWSFHRSMTRPYFSRDRYQHFDIFDRHADRFISLIKGRMNEGLPVDFQDLISRFTMDSATEFLFGSCVESLACTPPYPHNASANRPPIHDSEHAQQANSFTAAYGEAMQQIAIRQRLGPMWPLFEMFKDKTAAPMAEVAKYIDPLIQAAIDKKDANAGVDKANEEELCLLDDLVRSTSDPKVLRDEIVNILIAGRDTTMVVLTNAIYFLSTHPEVAARLREEVLSVVGPSARPTYDHIKQMKYMRAVLNETMRLYPPVPFNIRQSINPAIWPSPTPGEKPLYIPGGTTILYSVLLMHRRPDLWGPTADDFDPARFLASDPRHKQTTSHPFQFLPFNAGPRICLGQQFALNEMSFVLTRLLQNFDTLALDVDALRPEDRPPAEWRGCPGRKGIEQFVARAHLTLYAKGGLWVRMGSSEADQSS